MEKRSLSCGESAEEIGEGLLPLEICRRIFDFLEKHAKDLAKEVVVFLIAVAFCFAQQISPALAEDFPEGALSPPGAEQVESSSAALDFLAALIQAKGAVEESILRPARKKFPSGIDFTEPGIAGAVARVLEETGATTLDLSGAEFGGPVVLAGSFPEVTFNFRGSRFSSLDVNGLTAESLDLLGAQVEGNAIVRAANLESLSPIEAILAGNLFVGDSRISSLSFFDAKVGGEASLFFSGSSANLARSRFFGGLVVEMAGEGRIFLRAPDSSGKTAEHDLIKEGKLSFQQDPLPVSLSEILPSDGR
jgi:hypothetical protein